MRTVAIGPSTVDVMVSAVIRWMIACDQPGVRSRRRAGTARRAAAVAGTAATRRRCAAAQPRALVPHHRTGHREDVELPSPCLVVLVGPPGSGKSTWAMAQLPAH